MRGMGNSGDVKVWMVEDGRRLFVDKNANGDLTDDGPPIEPSKVRRLDANRWDFEYSLDAITPANGTRHSNFVLRRWNYNDKEDSYGLSLFVDGQMPMYAGWFTCMQPAKRAHARNPPQFQQPVRQREPPGQRDYLLNCNALLAVVRTLAPKHMQVCA